MDMKPKSTLFIFITVLFFLSCFFPGLSLADPLETWHWRNPLPQGNTLNDITYANDIFVAVGNNTVLTSSDGINWTEGSIEAHSFINGVSFGNGLFVAVGINGGVWISPDGVKWTPGSTGTDEELDGIAYGNGIFVAIGTSGVILTSPDGQNWTERVSGTNEDLAGIAYGNDKFVIAGPAYTDCMFSECPPLPHTVILTSKDGVTWTKNSLEALDRFNALSYGNGLFVGVGRDIYWDKDKTGIIWASPDGVNWTEGRLSVSDGLKLVTFNLVTYGNGAFVAVGTVSSDGGSQTVTYTSKNGINWKNWMPFSRSTFFGISYGNGLFVAVGLAGTTWTSPKGNLWTERSSGKTGSFEGIIHVNDIFVAVGDGIMTSYDGVQWTSRYQASDATFNDIAYGNGAFVAIGSKGILVSSDGLTWKDAQVSFPSYDGKVTYGNGIFVAMGGSGGDMVATSADGIAWTIQPFVSNRISLVNGITYGNGTFVGVGCCKGVFTSPDGTNWTEEGSGAIYARSVTYGSGIFVAVGNGIASSQDGITWTERLSTPTLSGITYSNGMFVAVGDGIWTSYDGVNWKNMSKTGGAAIASGNNTFVVVGGNGAIRQSDFLSGNCTTTLSPDLVLHVPIINFNGSYHWCDAACEVTAESTVLCRVSDYGEANPSDYADCEHSTLSTGLKMHIAAGVYNNISYDADFEYVLTEDGQMWFRLTKAERN